MPRDQFSQRVEALIEAYRQWADAPSLPSEDALCRMLADVHRYCFDHGIRFDAVMRLARKQFHEELQADEQ